jgi:hypothetical protein
MHFYDYITLVYLEFFLFGNWYEAEQKSLV